MNAEDRHERKRIIISRRLRHIADIYKLPSLSRAASHKLTDRCLKVIGKSGLTDADLRVLHKLTTRGLLD